MAFFSDYMIRGAHVKREIGLQRSSFTVLPLEIMSFTSLMIFVHAYGKTVEKGLLWIPFTRFALDKENKMISDWCLDQFEKTIGPRLPRPEEFGCWPITCLGQLIEGEGQETHICYRQL